jgi:hypothetical protein
LSDGRTVSGDTPAAVQVAVYSLEGAGCIPYQRHLSIEADHEPPCVETAVEVVAETDPEWADLVATICD